MDFLTVFRTKPNASQQRALQWLNEQPGFFRTGFTKLWRNNWVYSIISADLVDFTKVPLYFTEAEHQLRAIAYLEENCPPEIKQEFFRRWNAPCKQLTNADYIEAAKLINVQPAHIRAIVEVECRGSGFDDQGRPVILFEAAYFSYHTKGRYDNSHPHLSSKRWNPNLYTTNEWRRLEQAMRLDRTAAYMSCSWGIGQVMGENYKLAGHRTIDDFVAAMHESEAAQLKAMLMYIKSTGLDKHLRSNNWQAFALGYNGPGYAQNSYDTKLAEAYRKWSAK